MTTRTGARPRNKLIIFFAAFLLLTLSSLLPLSYQAPISTAVETQSSAIPSGLSFPYSYQQPSVPASIGAQGIQGPTVPLSQIGVSGQIGASGHLGPVNTSDPYALVASISTVEFHVLNGTTASSTNSNRAHVYLVNITTGRNVSGTTNAQGYVNLTATEGWWYAKIVPSAYGTEINYEQQLAVISSHPSFTRYLLPDGGSTVAVNNGGTGTIWFSEQTNAGPISQLNVELLNESAAGAVLAAGSTMNNGTIEFTSVGTGFAYALTVNGYYNPSTNVRYYLTNYTTATSTFSTNTLRITDSSMAGVSSTTGALSGVSLPAGNNAWHLTASTGITGGITYISAPISYGSAVTLTFTNALVFFNNTHPATSGPSAIRFHNSTVYYISEGPSVWNAVRSTSAIESDHSLFFGIADSALPVSADGLVMGFTNASHSLFYYMNSNYNGAVYGTFYNDIILNSSSFPMAVGNTTTGSSGSFYWYLHQDFSYVSVINSILTGGDIYHGSLNLYRSLLSNSTTNLAFLRINASEFMFNMTPETSFDTFNSHWFNMSHSNLIFSTPQNVSFIDYANTIPSNHFTNPPGAGSYLSTVSFNNRANGMGLGHNNLTFDYFGLTFPSINMTFTFGGFQATSDFYNDWFDYNWTPLQWNQAMGSYRNDVGGNWPSPAQTVPFEAAIIDLQTLGPVSVNYSYTNMANAWFQPFSHYAAGQGKHEQSYFAHDYFPYVPITENLYSEFIFPNDNGGGNYNISNCTFGYIYWNTTSWPWGNNQEGYAPIWLEATTNSVLNPIVDVNVTYDTFESPSFGAGGNGMAGSVQFAKYDINGIVSYCKFMNSPDYVIYAPESPNQTNYRGWYLPPHQDNILATAANVTIHDNWFLNLTNLTAPFGTDQAYQNGGWGGNTTEYNNHFFYYPLPGMTYINETWGFSDVGYYGQPVGWLYGAFNGSHLSYEIPVGQQATMRVLPGGAYIYNSTINQKPPAAYVVNDKGWTQGQPSQWSWIIEPNFIWNGSAYVAQYQGMGGPQPNLSFEGHQYQWSFEQNRTFISSDSLNAPPIPLAFDMPNPQHFSGTVRLYYYNTTSGTSTLLSTTTEQYPSTHMTVLYKPSDFGLSAIFWVNSTSVPPPPPKSYSVTFQETGLPSGTPWSVVLDGANRTSTGNSIIFSEPNGTYNFTIDQIQGYHPSIAVGLVQVNGSDMHYNISFAKNVFGITFNQSGLSGEVWSVTLGNSTLQSNSSTMTFYEANGTYAYRVTPPSNFTVSPLVGNVTIDGKTVVVSLLFNVTTSSPPPGPPPSNPSPPGSPIIFRIGALAFTPLVLEGIAAGAVLLVVALMAVTAILRRRR